MKKTKGFTLIELMIVVAIIGILAAIAIPKFADLIRKSKEGATKGSLASFRSAITIYYGEQEGIYPGTGTKTDGQDVSTEIGGVLIPRYLSAMPTVKLGISGIRDGNKVYLDVDCDLDQATTDNLACWGYTGIEGGHVFVDCLHVDSKDVPITVW